MSVSAEGSWSLPVEGWDVLTVIFAFQVDILAYGAGPSCTIRLAGAFTFTDADGIEHKLDAEQQSWDELTPLLSLRHDKLASVTASAEADLVVVFESGRTLRAVADARPYEHWELTAPGIRLIALPGDTGGVTVFEDA